MLNRNSRNLLAFISFNLGWWICFAGARYGWPYAGPIYCVFALGLHLWAFPHWKAELIYVLLLSLFGTVLDTSLIRAGLFQFRPNPVEWAPPWLIAMWTLFAMTMESSEPLRRKRWVLMVVSGVTAPISYFAGEAFDKIIYLRPLWISLPLHGLLWALLMPELYRLRDLCLRRFGSTSRS